MHFKAALNIYPVAFGEKREGDYAFFSKLTGSPTDLKCIISFFPHQSQYSTEAEKLGNWENHNSNKN